MELLAFLAFIAVSAFIVGKVRIKLDSIRRAEEQKIEQEESHFRDWKQQKIRRAAKKKREARSEVFRLWIQDAIDDWSEEGIRLIQSHKHALAMERKRLIKVNPYGIVDDEEWIEEGLPSFVESVLMPSLEKQLKDEYEVNNIDEIDCFMDEEWRNAKDAFIYGRYSGAEQSIGGREGWIESEDFFLSLSIRLEEEISTWCKEHIKSAIQNLSSDQSVEELSGIEYEDFCKDILVKHGWEVKKTKATGDQGVDLVAVIETIRACIQCKRFSSPVGNSAVQEITAGKLHWHGTHAVVVSNAGFTKSAQALARSTGVLLMSHEELADLENRLA